MLVFIIFALIGILFFMAFNNRVEIERTKKSSKKTIIIEPAKNTQSRKTEVVEFDADEENEDQPSRSSRAGQTAGNVLSSLWNRVK